MKLLISALIWASVVFISHESAAQGIAPSAYFTYGSTYFAATESFETITGSASQSGLGGGGRIDQIWRGLFADVGFSQQKLNGERVFVSGGTTFPLGIGTEITYRPIDIAAGWQFIANRVRPYVGAGATIVSYTEESEFAESGDDISDRKTGALLLAGVDVAIVRHVRVGGEFRYRAVTGILGGAGVSELFGEDKLGGVALAFRASVGR